MYENVRVRKLAVKVRQNVIQDANNSLHCWYIEREHAEHAEPAVSGYQWFDFEVGDVNGWWIGWTEVLPKTCYVLLDLRPAVRGPMLERCVLASVPVYRWELWIPDERELADDPLFRLPV